MLIQREADFPSIYSISFKHHACVLQWSPIELETYETNYVIHIESVPDKKKGIHFMMNKGGGGGGGHLCCIK